MSKPALPSQGSPRKGKDKPWLFRTYSGHSSAAASNELYRTNLKKGQTGLSVAFDLPTQTGYDSDHILARGEVGKVGVPICHLGDMQTLFRDIPLEQMNTSMTINAPSPWLLALYVAAAEAQGVDRAKLSGTVQNDIIKEYLSRGTYIFPPEPSMRLITDVISFTYREIPRWNPTNVCSYHLQEAGATPVQELAFALATSIAVLDAIKAGGQVAPEDFPKVVGRISFFVNAGLRFVTEIAKMRAFVDLWDEITRERYGVTDPKYRRFRYGVQVNSLGLTEQQPENNVYRIMIEMLAVVLSKKARARAVQLPAWNEALGLPRPWDQQWSLRLQQIMAMETDLLEYGDIFDGSKVMDEKVEALKHETRAEIKRIEEMGGAIAAVESAYMKNLLVQSNSRRIQAIESGEQVVVGVNRFLETAPSPLMSDEDGGIMTVDEKAEAQQIARLESWRQSRDDGAVARAIADLKAAAASNENIMEPSIAAARAGVTTGEWGQALRDVFGEYRAPTGVGDQATDPEKFSEIRQKVEDISKTLGGGLRFLVGKPGLDGHSNGAEQIAVRAAEAGMEVFYDGIRLTPDEIVSSALANKVHSVGLSILSGSHIPLVAEIMTLMEKAGLAAVPVVVGGIIPKEDEQKLLDMGVSRIYTPKDYQMTDIMSDIADMVGRRHNSYPY
ncbi:Ethylmalonyl-CoA mutase, methylsuccinyl-CoA-forming [hydrothermal vent metagenome]|uniref:Ethylmalonyl-CoA mutase, methylsuccinyl-CoA-forming n=1 Tax=hydrothermal vent metagenome TaxID=652676 RepID=A0A3B0SR01_9ZZZZ